MPRKILPVGLLEARSQKRGDGFLRTYVWSDGRTVKFQHLLVEKGKKPPPHELPPNPFEE
jgi:hypothetical protein